MVKFDEKKQKILIAVMRVVGICLGCSIILLSILFYVGILTSDNSDLKDNVLYVYRIVFGALLVIAELRLARLLVWFSFLLSYIGLGFYYLFIGGLGLGSTPGEIAIAVVAVFMGLAYCGIACCCPGVEKNMQADVVAQAQVEQQRLGSDIAVG